MDISKKYVVYELNNIMGNDNYKALEEISFDGFKQNSFDTEEEAIQALIDDEKTFVSYLILKKIVIDNFV